MSLDNLIKRLRDIMRNDAGVNGDAQRIEQMVWLLFLKVFDAKEEEWELLDDNYESIIPEEYRWRNWAVDDKSGNALTGDDLLKFINEDLFPALKDLKVSNDTDQKQQIVKYVFEDTNNYMKDGILLRQLVNLIDEIELDDYKDRLAFGKIYETILKDLQSAGSSGEFYTPRALTEGIVELIQPKIGETVADFACGTGGFLTAALGELDKQIDESEDSVKARELFNNSIFGIEKKSLPYLLCATNLLLHDVDNPNVLHDNALTENVKSYKEKDKFNVITMNPPYGGNELDIIKQNFPARLQSSETADLFMVLIMNRLKKDGRAAVILPDGFLFGTDNIKTNIKKELLDKFNLHTVIRLPHSVFSPYTSITTNILFFDNNGPTKDTWFYRLDMPEGYKNYSKTKPMLKQHFQPIIDWWNNREEIEENDHFKAKKYSIQEIVANEYNIDLCGFPHKEYVILPPDELIQNYRKERAVINSQIDEVLDNISDLLGISINEVTQ